MEEKAELESVISEAIQGQSELDLYYRNNREEVKTLIMKFQIQTEDIPAVVELLKLIDEIEEI